MDRSTSKSPQIGPVASVDRRKLLKSAAALAGGYLTATGALASPATSANAFPSKQKSDSPHRRIDVHLHAILPEYVKALARAGITEQSARKNFANTPEACLEAISGIGTDIAIWLPFSGSGIYAENDQKTLYLTHATNDAIAAFAAQVPKRFGFYGILPLPNVEMALQQMEYALDTLHADGIAFLSIQNGVYIGDPAFNELYGEMNRRSVTAFVHPARPDYPVPLHLSPALLEYTFETTRAAVSLMYNGVMKKYPNIRWVLAHAGGTLPYLTMRLQAQQGNDTRTPTFLDRIPEGYGPYISQFYYDVAMAGSEGPISALTAASDPSHLLYATDWPYVPKRYILQQAQNMARMPQFSGDRLRHMEHENASRLFSRFA